MIMGPSKYVYKKGSSSFTVISTEWMFLCEKKKKKSVWKPKMPKMCRYLLNEEKVFSAIKN